MNTDAFGRYFTGQLDEPAGGDLHHPVLAHPDVRGPDDAFLVNRALKHLGGTPGVEFDRGPLEGALVLKLGGEGVAFTVEDRMGRGLVNGYRNQAVGVEGDGDLGAGS